MWVEFKQALLRVGLSVLLTITYGNALNRNIDAVDPSPVKFNLYPQDHLHIVVNWTSDSTLQNVAYEIQVSRTENFSLIESVNISIKPQDSHNWTWTSKLPLQCTDHSVRMRTIFNSTLVGYWSQWKTLLGVHEHENDIWDESQIFPSHEVLREKSEIYFCCVAPRKAQVTSIIFNRTKYPLIDISSRVKAIAVDNLNITSEMGVIFECLNSSGDGNYTLNFVTFPPQKPRNMSCETEDLRRWRCTWNSGRQPNLINTYQRRYTLHVQNSNHSPLACGTSSCSFPAFSHLSEYVVTVEVANNLGKESERIKFNALDRIFPVAKDLSVIHGVAEANVSWTIEGDFTNIPMICQVKFEKNIMDIEQTGGLVMHFACLLGNLEPSTHYSAMVRCAVSGKGFGKWSNPVFFTTYPLVHVDIWRSIQALPSSRHVIITWRTFTTGSLSDVLSYEVELVQKSHLGMSLTNTTSIDRRVSQSEFFIDERGYKISVRANVQVGASIPASILIPPAQSVDKAVIPHRRLVGHGSTGFALSWTEDVSAVCGYTIEWCQNGSSAVPCTPSYLRWKTVYRGTTSLSLGAGDFSGGRRYTFNVLGCREDGHHLIETHVGFLEEQRPTQFVLIQNSLVVTSSSVTIEWSFPEDDLQHPCFITGYTVTLQHGHKIDQNPRSNISVDNPHSKSLTISGLLESTEYSFCIQPCSAVGPGPPTCHMIRTSPDKALFWVKILVPVVFLSGCCILLCSYWKRLRSAVLEIFTHPTKVSVKIVELDSCLYEKSKMIQALSIEDCMCCDLEVIDTRESVSECKSQGHLHPNKADSPFDPLTAEGCSTQLHNNAWDNPVSEMGLSVCNLTYSPTLTDVSFCLSASSSEAPTVGQLVQPHNMCDYVTCTGT